MKIKEENRWSRTGGGKSSLKKNAGCRSKRGRRWILKGKGASRKKLSELKKRGGAPNRELLFQSNSDKISTSNSK